jgi:hypothetical protein
MGEDRDAILVPMPLQAGVLVERAQALEVGWVAVDHWGGEEELEDGEVEEKGPSGQRQY